MKRIEIKRIEGKTLFKASLYIGCIPAAIFILIAIIMLLIAAATKSSYLILTSVYLLFYGLIYTVIAGLIYWFLAFLYNTFAKYFGGIKMEINIEEVEQIVEHVDIQN